MALPLPAGPQRHGPILAWAQQQMGIRLEPTHSIFGASFGEEQLAGVEAHLQVGRGRTGQHAPGVWSWCGLNG